MRETIISLIKKISGQANMLVIPRVFIDITDDFESAIMLSQLIYWSDRSQTGWVAKSQKDWEIEIGLTRRKLERAQKILKSLGVIETTIKKFNGTPMTHYKINYDALINILQSLNFDSSNTDKSTCSKNTSTPVQNEQVDTLKMSNSLTKITTEITTETTSSYLKEDDERQANIDNVNNLEWLRQKFRFYFGRDTLTPFENYKFEEMLKKYDREKLENAFEKAKMQNKMSIAYIEAILTNNGKKKTSIWDD